MVDYILIYNQLFVLQRVKSSQCVRGDVIAVRRIGVKAEKVSNKEVRR